MAPCYALKATNWYFVAFNCPCFIILALEFCESFQFGLKRPKSTLAYFREYARIFYSSWKTQKFQLSPRKVLSTSAWILSSTQNIHAYLGPVFIKNVNRYHLCKIALEDCRIFQRCLDTWPITRTRALTLISCWAIC